MAIVLIVGATGKQGGATVKALQQELDHPTIRVLTRNPESARAKQLSQQGIEIFKGDLSDRASLLAALDQVNAVHLVTDFTGPEGAKGEILQGRLFVDCAKEQGVSHVVYSSVAGAEDATNVPHFHSKHVIEEYIKASSMTYTFLRPTAFMENIPRPGIPRFFFYGAMKAIFGNLKIYNIATADIGRVAAQALTHPEKHRNRIIHLVSDIATVDEMQRTLDSVEGYTSWRAPLPQWLLLKLLPKEFYEMTIVVESCKDLLCLPQY